MSSVSHGTASGLPSPSSAACAAADAAEAANRPTPPRRERRVVQMQKQHQSRPLQSRLARRNENEKLNGLLRARSTIGAGTIMSFGLGVSEAQREDCITR